MSLFDAVEKEGKSTFALLKESLQPSTAENKKILAEHPDLDLTSDIEKELIFQKKLKIAVGDPEGYLAEKEKAMIELGTLVNAKFAEIYADVIKYSTRTEAKELALKASKTTFELGKYKLDAMYPERIDKGIESKLLFELSQKLIDKSK